MNETKVTIPEWNFCDVDVYTVGTFHYMWLRIIIKLLAKLFAMEFGWEPPF